MPSTAYQLSLRLVCFKLIFLACLCFSFSNKAKAQDAYAGVDFWLGFMPNNGASGTQTLYLTAATATSATVTIPSANPVFTSTVNIAANAVVTVSIPAATGGINIGTPTPNAVTKTGIHVTSTNPVSVYALSDGVSSAEAYIGIPSANVGNRYITVSPEGGASGPAAFMALAIEDGTIVTFKLPAGKAAIGRGAGSTWTINLNKGETYYNENTGQAGLAGDLTGTVVSGNKPFAMFSGAGCIQFPGSASKAGYASCGPCDHIIEQLTPVSTWGKSFVASDFVSTTLAKQAKSSYIRVVTSDAGVTSFSITGYPPQTLTGVGNYMDYLIDGGVVVTSDKPIAAYGIASGNTCYSPLLVSGVGDPSLIALVPEEQWGKSSPFVCPQGSALPFSAVINVYAKSVNPNITIDGTLYNGFTAIGTSGFYYKSIKMANGTHLATSTQDNFMVYVYGTGVAISYAYPAAGPTLKKLDKTILAGFTADTVCFGSATTFKDTTFIKGTAIASWEWSFGDGTFASTKNTSHIYQNPGTYNVKLLVRDTVGDADSTTKVIVVKALPTVILNSPPAICLGDTVSLQASGGDTYLWTPPATLTAAMIANPKAFPSTQTTYNLKVTSAATKCFKDTSLTVALNPKPSAAISGLLEVCSINGSTNLTASGGVNYLWQPGGQINPTIAVTPSVETRYLVTVTNSFGCKDTLSAVVKLSPQPSGVVLSSVDRSCTALNGNFAVSNVVGGKAPYLYSRNGGIVYQASNTFSGLDSGSYTIRVRDNLGCLFDSIALVGITQAPTAIDISTTASGCGSPTGSVSLNSVTGGRAPYTYSKDGITYQATNTFSPLGSGGYLVYAKDDNGCVYSANATVGSSTGPNDLTITDKPATCGNSNGEITITNVSGGNAPYTYSNDGVTYQSGSTFTGYAAGNTTVYVKDAANCVFSKSVNITGIAGIADFDAVLVSETCDLKNGTLTVFDEKIGLAPYTYSIDGTTFQTQNVYTGLASGAVNVTVKDRTNCIFSKAFAIPYSKPISAVTDVPTNSTCGKSNGSVVFAVSDGLAPFTVSIDGNSPTTELANFTINSLTPANHLIQITDANSCVYNGTFIVNNTDGPTQIISSTTETSCTVANGSITIVNVVGGTAPYTFRIGTGTFSNTSLFTGLAAQSFTVEVQDANACVFSTSVTVATVNSPSNISTTNVNTTCTTNNGSITITGVTGGTAPYIYKFGTGSFSANTVFSNLSSGSFTIEVQDVNLCNYSKVISLSDSPSPTAIAVQALPSSCGRANGSITFTGITGGTAPYEYAINAGSFSSATNYPDLSAGVYSLRVRDANACQYSDQVSIDNIAGPSGIKTAFSNDTCGRNSGSISVTAITGTATPFTYTLNTNPPTTQANPIFANVPVGSYSLSISDANGCNTTRNFVISSIKGPTNPTLNITEPHCALSDGSVQIDQASIATGTVPFTYSLKDANGTQAGAFNALTYSLLKAGNYTLEVSDKYACKAIQTLILTDIPGPSNAVFNVTESRCNFSNGSLNFENVIGGTAPYQYSSDNTVFSANTLFENLNSGTNQQFYIRDAAGCGLTISANIPGQPGPTAILATAENENCDRKDGKLSDVRLIGGTPPLMLQIVGFSPILSGETFINLAAGVYTVTGKDANDCLVDSNFVVAYNPAPTASFTTSEDFGEEPLNVYFGNTSINAINFNWSFGNGVSSMNNSPMYMFQDSGSFEVQMVAFNKAGCSDTALTTIVVSPSVGIYLPNTFTPDNDGINDTYSPIIRNIISYELFVFNRWGEQIAKSTEKDKGWDGTYNNVPMKSDVYSVRLKAIDILKREHVILGKVHLLR